MTADTLRNDPGNGLNALKSSARRTPDSRLVGTEAAGLLFSLVIWIWIPERWPLALPFLAISAFGMWGVTDHTLVAGRRTMSQPLWVFLRVFRWIVGFAGVVAVVATLYLIVGELIGTVVS